VVRISEKIEPKYKKLFFAICRNCGTHVYEHDGYREHPKGQFNCFYTCPNCGTEDTLIIQSNEARKREIQNRIKAKMELMDFNTLINAAEKMIKTKLQKDADDFVKKHKFKPRSDKDVSN